MTPSAKEFITPLTLSTLTHTPVVSEFFDREKLMSMLDAHKSGKKNYARIIYTVYSFLLWYEQYFVLR